ncbi:MAG: alpha-amylase family glycosyl hydrolase [Bacteroidota bacterium]
MSIAKYILMAGLMPLFLGACTSPENESAAASTQDTTAIAEGPALFGHPEWARSSNIYEVNIRQYTPEGTFNAFAQHLPRLKAMGVDILWLMPIHPIGEKKRKGGLGSPYSIQDYRAVNPDFGTDEDFRNLVQQVHAQGMHIIIDWVANHSAWDNALLEEHPEWYTKDSTGNFMAPVPDWSDVVDFNYDEAGLRAYMIESLEYWVKEFDIDGYRCDVAMMVPTDFWNEARQALDAIKPVFMLAEAEQTDHHEQAFDMSYGWEFHHWMNQMAKGERGLASLDSLVAKEQGRFPTDAYRMCFTSNHDENSWNGTVAERLGKDAAPAFAVLSATLFGMPLIYSGQEAGLDHRLSFFEKDQIDWEELPYEDLYRRLLTAKEECPALWNGAEGGTYRRLTTTNDTSILAFAREKGADKAVVIINMSDQKQVFSWEDQGLEGNYRDVASDGAVYIQPKNIMTMIPWGFYLMIPS